MRRRLSAAILAGSVAVLAAPLLASRATIITGSVIGEGARPIAGATVEVVRAAAEPRCATTTTADGTFSLVCEASGRHTVRASFGDLRPWQVDEVELGPGHEVHLNFMLLPATMTAAAGGSPTESTETAGFWSRRLPNPVVATWQGRPITLRVSAIATAAVSFLLGALTMLALGRRFGVETRRLSPGEVGDLVLNPHMPSVGQRVSPIAVAGARGASATVSFGADEIAAALGARRYGVVVLALVVAPAFFALFSLALAAAMLAGQELYLFLAMLIVPTGFLLTPIVIGIQAITRRRNTA
jgi:hypothetical protein